MVSPVHHLIILVAFVAAHTDASLMGKGGGFLGGRFSSKNNRIKPWDTHRKNHLKNNFYYENHEPNKLNQQDLHDGKEPCIGLCYYKKVLALQNKDNMYSQEENGTVEDEIVFEELTTKKPCIGICQYYRSKGIENPYEDKNQ